MQSKLVSKKKFQNSFEYENSKNKLAYNKNVA